MALIGYLVCTDKADNRLTLTNALMVAQALPPEIRSKWGDRSSELTYARLHRLFARTVQMFEGGNVGG